VDLFFLVLCSITTFSPYISPYSNITTMVTICHGSVFDMKELETAVIHKPHVIRFIADSNSSC